MSKANTLYIQLLVAQHLGQGFRSDGYAATAVETGSIEVSDPDTGESWLVETKVFELLKEEE